ncbi:FtsH protease activity modulator HflK [Sphingomonas sp. BIUV-7]|uniref:Protein HflK n=1 Tax=Sphingomonas natans TaxID=3063330 RepID=A0ABT8Y712_9SPHN|nr:FtsH protease activity modulator HflK [Sphingomonas sp. BIUV-7]MDO6413802.1 FtsH protease activity modulator HflK [Sphingomonas sp. BIUV-7]
MDASGQAGETGAVMNEGGPWGGGSGGDGGSGPPRNPWSGAGKPASGKPGPSALDALVRRGRARFGGGGGGGIPQLPGGSIWLWGVLGLILLWIALTTAHTIGPQQRGVITRFGRYVGMLQPGLGFSLPAPIDIVRKIDVDNIHVIDIESGADGASGQNLMLTGDENMIDLAYSVRWNIRDPELYMFELADPDGTIREVAESAMREQISSVTLNAAIGPQRAIIEQRVAARMQELLDEYRAGVAVQGVAIKQADPPSEVMDAFKEVSAAQQQAQSYLNQARAYATQVGAKASGESIAFDQTYAQYKLAPEVTRRRMYYETMEKVLAKTDKTILEAGGVTPYLPIPPKGAAK